MTTSTRHTQLIAWSVVLASFAVLLAILLGLPSLGLRYVRAAMVRQDAAVASKSGAVQLAYLASTDVPQSILTEDSEQRTVGEGWTITTTAASRALVSFSDQSTAHLDPYTGLTLVHMRRPRFPSGRMPPVIDVLARAAPGHTARLALGTAYDEDESLPQPRFRVTTPLGDELATIELGPESNACLELTGQKVNVVGLAGKLAVQNAYGAVHLEADQRTQIERGSGPDPVVPRLSNLVKNAHFRSRPLTANGWKFRFEQPDSDAPPQGYSRGEALADGRTVVRFVREGSEGRPADMILEQPLGNYEMSTGTCAPTYFGLRGTVRILRQSLPGGGMRSTEYPIKLKLTVKDRNGEQLPWTVGFYGVAPSPENDPEGLYHTADGVQVALGEWVNFDSGNLLDPATPFSLAKRGIQGPLELVRLELIASGHDFESEVDSVSLWVR